MGDGNVVFFSVIAIIIILLIWEVFTQRELIIFHWSLSDSNSSNVSWTLLCILTDIKSSGVWMVTSCPLISQPSRHCINYLVTLPSSPITIGITDNFILHRFFSSLTIYRNLYLFSLSFNFTRGSAKTETSNIRLVIFFFSWLSINLVVWPRLGDLFVSQNPKEFIFIIF